MNPEKYPFQSVYGKISIRRVFFNGEISVRQVLCMAKHPPYVRKPYTLTMRLFISIGEVLFESAFVPTQDQ